MSQAYYFRCKSNPRGPLLILESFNEAQEMKTHPDYERVDELGEVIKSEDADAPHPMPFHAAGK